MSVHIAVDIGGTHMRAAYYPAHSHEPLVRKKIDTRHPSESVWDRLVKLIASIWPADEKVAGIGVAAPGPLDPYNGILFSAPNIPEWVNLPIGELLQEQFRLPVAVGNDANLAALGEWTFGAGIGHKHLVYMTISTGIGGGVIVDNRLLVGARGIAAELGHVTVQPDGPLCGCGQRGHLEALAAGPAIARWVEAEIKKGVPSSLGTLERITTKQVAEAANLGDDLSTRALDRAGTYIGRALADILHIFNPSIIVLGGGVSRSGDLLMNPIRKEMEARVMNPHYLDNLTLTTAALGDETGLLGALALARETE